MADIGSRRPRRARTREHLRVDRHSSSQSWIDAREAVLAVWLDCLDRWGWPEPTAQQREFLRRKAARLLNEIELDGAEAAQQFLADTNDDSEIELMHCLELETLPWLQAK